MLEKGWDFSILLRFHCLFHPVAKLLSPTLWRGAQQALADPKERQLPVYEVILQRRPPRRKHSDASHKVLREDLFVKEGLIERRFL